MTVHDFNIFANQYISNQGEIRKNCGKDDLVHHSLKGEVIHFQTTCEYGQVSGGKREERDIQGRKRNPQKWKWGGKHRKNGGGGGEKKGGKEGRKAYSEGGEHQSCSAPLFDLHTGE
jgi:hypothetical protein